MIGFFCAVGGLFGHYMSRGPAIAELIVDGMEAPNHGKATYTVN